MTDPFNKMKTTHINFSKYILFENNIFKKATKMHGYQLLENNNII